MPGPDPSNKGNGYRAEVRSDGLTGENDDGSGGAEAGIECAICYSSLSNNPALPLADECKEEADFTSMPASFQLGSASMMDTSTGIDAAPNFFSGGEEEIVACSNIKCNRRFHRKCVIEWLQSLPSTRSSFGSLFGTCPYCSEGVYARL